MQSLTFHFQSVKFTFRLYRHLGLKTLFWPALLTALRTLTKIVVMVFPLQIMFVLVIGIDERIEAALPGITSLNQEQLISLIIGVYTALLGVYFSFFYLSSKLTQYKRKLFLDAFKNAALFKSSADEKAVFNSALKIEAELILTILLATLFLVFDPLVFFAVLLVTLIFLGLFAGRLLASASLTLTPSLASLLDEIISFLIFVCLAVLLIFYGLSVNSSIPILLALFFMCRAYSQSLVRFNKEALKLQKITKPNLENLK